MNIPKPITRKDMYYSYLINGAGSIPQPITRLEQYLYYLCKNGFGSGGAVTPEMIDNAVNKYLEENPVEPITDYEKLENKPSINNTVLDGNKNFEDLGMIPLSNMEIMQIISKATN